MNPPDFKSVLLFAVIFSNSLFGQEKGIIPKPSRHFLNFSLGPSFATNKYPAYTVEERPNGVYKRNYFDIGLGKGFSFTMGYTFYLSKVLGLEINGTRLIGGSVKYDNIFYHIDSLNPYSIVQHQELKAGIWKVNLLICGRLPYKRVQPYFKSGFIFSTGDKLIRSVKENVTYTNGGTAKGEFEVLNSGGNSYGLNAVIGVDIPLANGVLFFTELNYSALSHKWKKWETTKYAVNGKSLLSSLPSNMKSGTYADSQPFSNSNSLTYKTSLSSISVMFGFKIALQKINI